MIIDIYKRPAGKTGWKLKGGHYTASNKKLLEALEALKNNAILNNSCLVRFHNLGLCETLGLDLDSIHIIENKLFSLEEACEFIQARIDGKRVELSIIYI